MLLEVFLAQAGSAFIKKFLNTDTFGSEKFTLGDAIGSFIGSMVTSVTGNAAYDQVNKLSQSLRVNGLPVNHDVQRSIRKAYLLSLIEVGRYVNRHHLYKNMEEKELIKRIVGYLNDELKKLVDVNYIPEQDNPANKAYGYLANKFVKLDTEITTSELQQQLQESVLQELEFHLYVKAHAEIPVAYSACIRNGWQENSKNFSFFDYMCDYFQEFLKTDGRLKSVLQTEWLTQLLANSNEIKKEITGIYVKLEDSFAKLGAQSLEATGKLSEIITLLKPQPILKYVFDTKGFHKTLFKSRYLDLFLGRKDEIKLLLDFFENDQVFAWWLITGSGGLGKSRLAMEFCFELSYYHTVNMGFGTDASSLFKFDWSTWQPLSATLIIVDYASGHYEDIIQVFECLSNREQEFHFPVRFLLLEREAKGTWWEEIQKKLGHKISKQPYAPPIELKELRQEDLWEIMVKVLNHFNKPIPSKKSTLDNLKYIDNKGRPLFAWFAAFAIAEGENIRNWNINNLLEKQLYREESRVYESLQESKNNVELINLHKSLVAIGTMCGGLSLNDIERILSKDYPWLPNLDNFSVQIYNLITGLNEKDHFPFGPIEPDILGEFFVLQQLGTNGNNLFKNRQKGIQMVKWAWNIRAQSMVAFIYRAFGDFSNDPLKKILLTEPLPEDSNDYKRFWSAVATNQIRWYGMNNDIAEAEKLYEKLNLLAQSSPLAISYHEEGKYFIKDGFEKEVWIELAKATTNLVLYLYEEKPHLAVPYYKELQNLASRHDLNEIWIEVAKTVYNLSRNFGPKDLSLAADYYSELMELALKHDLDEIWIITAEGGYNLITYCSEIDLSRSVFYYNHLKVIATNYPIREIWIELSKADYNLILAFGKQNPHLAIPYYNNLKEIANNYPSKELWIDVAGAARHLSNDFGKIDPNLSVPYYNELKSVAETHNMDDIWSEVIKAVNNLCFYFFNKSNRSIALSYYEEFKAIFKDHPSKEGLPLLANLTLFLNNHLSKENPALAIPYHNVLKALTQQYPNDNIWDLVSEATYNLCVSFFDKDLVQSIYYFEELKLFAQDHPSKNIIRFTVVAAAKLIAEYGVQNLYTTVSLYEDLKALVEKDITEANVISLVTSAYNITKFCLDENIYENLDTLFYTDIYLLAQKYDLPELWLCVEMSISLLLQFPGVVNAARSKIY